MKYFRLKIYLLLFILGFIFLPAGKLLAANLSFSPVTVNVNEEQSFSSVISLDPKGEKIFTAKVEVSYPADLFEVRSFNFSKSWMPLSQPGYDLIDNQNGKLIRTGGYPGGVSSKITFGTISFTAKKSGAGIVKAENDSLILDAENKNIFTGTATQAITVSASTFVLPEEPKEKVPSFEIPSTIPFGYIFETDLEIGDRSIDVAYLQTCLRVQGMYSGDIDGDFGSSTKNAVIAFQEKYFDEILAPWGFNKGTGLVSDTTISKLNELCLPVQESAEEEEPPLLLEEVVEPTPLFDIQVEPEKEPKKIPILPIVVIAIGLIIVIVALIAMRKK